MAHKQSAKRTPASKKPVSKKLLPPSSRPSSENEEEEKDQQQNLESPLPLPPHAPSPKQSKSKKNKKKENENENDDETEEKDDHAPALRMNWKVEDETAILKGMAAFKASTHHDPYKDAEAFRDFMKESEYSLPEASIVQLKAKIRKMKSKFARGIGGHEFKELAKKVWEPEKNAECEEAEEELELEQEQEQEQERERNSKRMSGSGSKRARFAEPEWEEKQERDDEDDSNGIIGNWSEVLPGVSEEVLNRAFNSIEASERAEWVARWEKHKIAEFELCVNKTELIRDLARLMWGAYKSFNN